MTQQLDILLWEHPGVQQALSLALPCFHEITVNCALRRARWDPTKVNDVTYTGELVPQQLPAQTAPIRITVLGSWWAALLLICTTMMCLTSAFTAFILYVRPVLQVPSASSQHILHMDSVPSLPCCLCSYVALPSQSASQSVQRTERAALACEIAAQGMEEACEELEKASEVHTDTFPVPHTVQRMPMSPQCFLST